MQLLSLLNIFLCLLQVAVAQQPIEKSVGNSSSVELPLDRLRSFIESNSHKRPTKKPLYTKRTIEDNVVIPQYDVELQDYEGSPFLAKYHITFERMASQLIKEAEASRDQEALVYLGDLYMFGQSDIRANYSKALEYYKKAVEGAPHGHAYFMLGYIYSTGMFGELPQDKAKSNLYYQFASENGNLNATLVLANKYLHGIDRAPNCDLSKFYYSRAARIVKKYQNDHGHATVSGDPLYNIRLADFNGGLYGRKVSDQISSFQSFADYDEARRQNLEDNNYNHDPELRDLYYDALAAYTGSRFKPSNLTVANDLSRKCMAHAKVKFGKNHGGYISDDDKSMWSRCACILGNLYFEGTHFERDIPKAYEYFNMANKIFDSAHTRAQLGKVHALDPITDGSISDNCTRRFKSAAEAGNFEANYLLAKWYSVPDPASPFLIQNTARTLTWWRDLAMKGHFHARFYYADAMESGDGASSTDVFYCSTIVDTYKQFVERSEQLLFPHLKYAFEEFIYGHFKNALVGYSIAAEQGLKNSQVSAAFLLYQANPVFTWTPKFFNSDRLESAMSYLELASLQGDIDSTILLGDISYDGVESTNIPQDYEKAFTYYSRAATAASPHGCFKLGHMYEYGRGSANATVDFHMAKRYYDLSVKYTLQSPFFRISRLNTYAMSLALLRLRVKLLFSRDKKDVDKAGWFSTFKKLGRSQDSIDDDEDDERALQKSTAHFEGGDFEGEDEYEIFDYVVLLLTVVFFIFVFVSNMRGQMRRAANGPNQPNQQRNAGDQFGFRRGNFEFHFFAL
ncbi:hypothetical protein FT663_00826 [Candidozyma haemuli var. vulneris]|nr:hypothetical protein FT662_00918 [[Candida] haemuloni var. vulneris]KAF3995127.1 hypothetical protein FT663_00826 [[Candida] haemuloni var. vulneris]